MILTVLPLGVSSHGEPSRQEDERWIRTVSELRELTPEEANLSRPVRITGVITYLEPGRSLAFIQDDTGGTYFASGYPGSAPDIRTTPPYKVGDKVKVTGISSSGSFAPIVRANPGQAFTEVKILGRESMPSPTRLDPGRLFDPSRDGSWIETTGVVRRLSTSRGRLTFEVTNGIENFQIIVPGEWPNQRVPNEYVGSSVRVSGVFAALTDRNNRFFGIRIFTPELWQVTIIDQGADQAFDAPVTPIDQLRQYRNNPTARVHVRGIVTATFPGQQFFIRSNDTGLAISSPEMNMPRPGSVVDVVGFPLLKGESISLHTPVVRVASVVPPPPPVAVAPTALDLSHWHGNLIRTEARLINSFLSENACLLLLNDGDRTFSARVPLTAEDDGPDFRADSWLRITGIALTQKDPTQRLSDAKTEADSSFRGLSLLARSVDDIVLLREPPFWTARRILLFGMIVGLLLVISLIWNALLRNRVSKQTSLISAKIKGEHIAAERIRIAQELHDSLEQELAGIGLQLDLAHTRGRASPERALPAVELALRMLRRTQQETRASIQDLRSGLLEERDLATALREAAERLIVERRAAISLELTQVPRLPTVTEHNLLRIAQEGLNNAAQHAQAEKITLSLQSKPDGLILEIKDDGIGFDSTKPHPGHFGQQGMRERALKIGAKFALSSHPGKGTCIYVSLPWPTPSPPIRNSLNPSNENS